MMGKTAPSPDISEIVNAVRVAVSEGESIVEKAREDHRLSASFDDGPHMTMWKRRDQSAAPPPSALNDVMTGMVARIVEAERTGRWVTASMGLAQLRRRF